MSGQPCYAPENQKGTGWFSWELLLLLLPPSGNMLNQGSRTRTSDVCVLLGKLSASAPGFTEGHYDIPPRYFLLYFKTPECKVAMTVIVGKDTGRQILEASLKVFLPRFPCRCEPGTQ